MKSYSAMSVLGKLIRFAKPYYGKYVLLGVLIFVKAVLGVATAEIFRQMVTAAMSGNISLLWGVLAAAVGIAVALLFLGIVETAISVRLQNRSSLDFQTFLLNKLFRVRMQEFSKLSSADWINRVQQSAETAMSAVNTRAVLIVGDILQIAFLFAYLTSISGSLLFGSLCVAVCVPMLVSPLSGKLRKHYDAQQEIRADRDGVIQSMLHGGEEVRTFSLADDVERLFQRQYKRLLAVSRKVIRLESGIALGAFAAPLFGILFILGYGGILVSKGELAVGDVVAFLIGMERMIGPVSGLAQVWPQTQDAVSNGRRVLSVTELPEEQAGDENAVGSGSERILPERTSFSEPPRIAFEGVSFRYNESKLALQNITFTIEHGQMTAIIGASGAGKSTLVHMITRLIEPEAGRLVYGNVPFSQISPHQLREKIAYVPQHDYLFSMSILENIRMGDPHFSEQDVALAAQAVNIHEWIMRLEDGYATVLNEGGVNLSGGERQRIALARAVLRKPDFIVLDEPTSHLDVRNEQAVMDTLQKLSADAGIVVVTHRTERLDLFHKVIEIEQGRLAGREAKNG